MQKIIPSNTKQKYKTTNQTMIALPKQLPKYLQATNSNNKLQKKQINEAITNQTTNITHIIPLKIQQCKHDKQN